MKIAVATDFNGSGGIPLDSLKAIAEAGFTHLHWCHQWCTDYLYSDCEIQQIKTWLKDLGLTLLDIHGSQGNIKRWNAADYEFRRKSGVELVLNRARMLRELDGEGVLMMHMPVMRSDTAPEARPGILKEFDALCRSIDEMAPELEKLHVTLAMENLGCCNFELISKVLSMYPPHLVGITYDSGHGNIREAKGLDYMEQHKDRLQALHLHDNDGTGDLHQPPFYGNIDWDRLTTMIATSSYPRMASFELSMANTPFYDKTVQTGPQDAAHVKEFLKDAYVRCSKVAVMLEEKRKNPLK